MARPPRRRPPIPTKPSAAASAGNIHLTPADFAFAATRTAAAQVIQSIGFASVQRSALDTLSELAGRYLSAVSASAAAATTSGGRTEANIYDVVTALEDVGSDQGFSGASNLNRRILSSSVVTDLSRFVDCSLEIPFSQAFRRCPEPPRRILGQFGQLLPWAGYRHIPSWLPAFPDIKMEKKEVKKKEGLYGCFSSEETEFFNEESMVLVDGKKENVVLFDGKKENIVLVDEKTSIDSSKKRARVGYIDEESMALVDGKKENIVLVDGKTSIDSSKKRARVGYIDEESMILVDGKKEIVVLVDEKTSIGLPKKRARVGYVNEEKMVLVDGKKENVVLVDERTSIDSTKKRARVGYINEDKMVLVDGKKENDVLVDERTGIDMPKKRAGVGCINEENMVLVDGKKENVVVFDEKTGIDMPKKRARVRFKVGVRGQVWGAHSRNGVCKGGKRVFCENGTKDDDENDDNNGGKKMKMMTMKCDSGLNRGEERGNGGLVAPLLYYRRRKRLL